MISRKNIDTQTTSCYSLPCISNPIPARQVVLQIPSKSLRLTQLPSRRHSAFVSPLAATFMNLPASVANKRLTAGLSPLVATLTKTGGGEGTRRGTLLSAKSLRTCVSALFFPVPASPFQLQRRPTNRSVFNLQLSIEDPDPVRTVLPRISLLLYIVTSLLLSFSHERRI